MKIFISGVPGTGKTTVAEYLAAAHGFSHIDMECDGFRGRHEIATDSGSFLAALPEGPVVITWGFGPFTDRTSVGLLSAAGYRLVWLDGDRVASFREFMRRESGNPVMESMYYGQMQMIVATEIVGRLQIPVVNPFRDGEFRPVGDVAADILATVAHLAPAATCAVAG